MKEREKELDSKKDFFEWLVFKFHGLSSNHSQDWDRSRSRPIWSITPLTMPTPFSSKRMGGDCSIAAIFEHTAESGILSRN